MKCAECRETVREEWPRGVTALRCFDDRSGIYHGRVTHLLRPGQGGYDTHPPAWCPEKNDEEK